MSRQIDMSKPLSAEDRAWLIDNNREDEVRANDEAHGRDSSDLGTARGAMPFVTGQEPSGGADRMIPTGLTPNSANADLDRERREAQLKAAMEGPSSSDGAEAGDLTYETDDNPYEDWKLDALQNEAGKRELSKSGTKAELADRLRADDEERDTGDTE
jgi:hypothetical protein